MPAEVKTGRILSAANEEALRETLALIDAILEANKTSKAAQKHLAGQHDQSTHSVGGSAAPRAGMGDVVITDQHAADFSGGSAAPHLQKNANGAWEFTPERQALHDEIVRNAVEGVPKSENPTYHLTGGGPAAGKSTMIKQGGADVPTGKKAVQVNADDVKEQLPEYRQMTAASDPRAAAFSHEESSYVAKRIQAAGMERGCDVVLDGTGNSSEKSVRKKIDTARAHGYRVVANYATVPTDIAVTRAAARGQKTGRYIPESVTRGTHSSVSRVFPKVATHFDEVTLWDTTGAPKVIARGKRGSLSITDQDGWESFIAKGNE